MKGSRLAAGRAHGGLRQLFATCAADVTPLASATAPPLHCFTRRPAPDASGLPSTRRLMIGAPARSSCLARETGSALACAGARRAVDAWIAIRGPAQGSLVGPVGLRVMTPQAVMTRLKRRSEQADIARCSPHDPDIRQRPAQGRRRGYPASRRTFQPAHHSALRPPRRREPATDGGAIACPLASNKLTRISHHGVSDSQYM